MIFQKLIIPRLEIHASHYCNLRCDNCNHFSNFAVNGNVTSEEFYEWNIAWSNKIMPLNYQICGGEPTLNKELSIICKMARKIWNKCPKIILVTNGFYLKLHQDLPEILEKNNIKIIISIHDDSHEYQEKLKDIKNTIYDWRSKYNFDFHFRESFKDWRKTFKKNDDGRMVPFFDNNIKSSYDKCLSKDAKQLFQGKIHKCPPVAYLKLIKKKYDLNESWDHFLNYKPLEITASYKEMEYFFKKEEESYCNMCSSNPTTYKKPNPLIQLNIKKF